MSQLQYINVTKKYENDFYAVEDVSFNVEKGEFVFIVGPSGAGKSTLISMLISDEKPDEGQIIFNDLDITNLARQDVTKVRRKIGVVFQDFKILNSKSVFDNVAVALEVVNTSKHEINEVVPNVLNLVGLADKRSQLPYKLSGGEKQRLAIARALAHEPDILVADEPTGMIDPKAKDEVVDLLEKINVLGTTVLMATHDQAIVDRLQKRVIRIENGKLMSDQQGGYENVE